MVKIRNRFFRWSNRRQLCSFHAGLAFGHAPAVAFLLEMGANVATQDIEVSPLHVACSTAGDTPLHVACNRPKTLQVWNKGYAMEEPAMFPLSSTKEVEEQVVRSLLEADASRS